MLNALGIFFGGGLGSLARWGASDVIANRFGQTFPWGTLTVNITGSFTIKDKQWR
jgi:CrcB protein